MHSVYIRGKIQEEYPHNLTKVTLRTLFTRALCKGEHFLYTSGLIFLKCRYILSKDNKNTSF